MELFFQRYLMYNGIGKAEKLMKKASYERELYIDKFVRNSNISGASVFLVSGTQDAQPKYYVDTLIYRYLRNRTDECAV